MTTYSEWLIKDGFVILLFHGVIRAQRHAIRNYTRKHLTLDRFETILRDLCAHGMPVSLPQIVDATRAHGALPPRAFAITFDDGFANNVTVAAPVLKQLQVPATFYVTTGFVESNGSSWTDMIEYAVERTPEVALELPGSGHTQTISVTREEKIALLDEIRRIVKGDPQIDPYQFAGEVWRQLGVQAMDVDLELDQKMTWDQVRALADDPLFTIGGHGQTHRILAFLTADALEQEITRSLEALRRHTGAPSNHYSYPEGLAHCYSEQVIHALRRQGVLCGVTAEAGVNHVGDDLFRLKRVLVED